MPEHKKSLGQHFLHSGHYLSLIADCAHLSPGERVLEVGPGDGALTRELIARGARVIAIEKDRRLIPVLTETFAKEIADGSLRVVEGDILRVDMSAHISPNETYIVVANIPYYITGALLKKLLTAVHQPERAILLIQKEVAERIARSKKESVLSLSVKVYGEPRYVKTVPRGAFTPPPEVDSAVLEILNISRNNFKDAQQEKKFFTLVRAGFAQKRKLLARNLEPLLGTEYSNILQNVGISLQARAEDVPLEQWLALSAENTTTR